MGASTPATAVARMQEPEQSGSLADIVVQRLILLRMTLT
jgi:hypothetical protein